MSDESPAGKSPAGIVTRIIRRAVLTLLLALLLGSVPAARLVEAAPARYHYIPLFFWPLDDEYRTVYNYPDDSWTWDFLGLAPGKACPGYYNRDRASTYAVWR